jgi:tetratricopeptide (TPR) repeat protein
VSRLLPLLLAGTVGISLPSPLDMLSRAVHLPAAVERWLWNPRERMNTAIAEERKNDPESRRRAVAAADTAVRLAPGDPLVQYDAGTVHLNAGAQGSRKDAAALLEQAAKGGGPGLVGAASYNLGNARLADGDFDGAITAYQQALRTDPADRNAKWNLELALRGRRDRSMKGPSGSPGGQGGGQKPSQGPNGEQPSPEQKGGNTADPGQSREQQGGTSEKPGSQGQAQPRPGNQPLPQFHDQPDMTASEAAALLEAVENLERQQRRAQAAQRAQRRVVKGKDW